jgi:hypothetical protein
MNSIRIENNTSTILREIPSSWKELTKDQLLFVAPRVMLSNANIELLREMAIYFLMLPKSFYRLMNLSQLDAIAETFNFFWLANDLSIQHISFVKPNLFRKLYGPASRLENCSAAEWAFADKFLNAFLKTKDENDLNSLVACLYRPAFKNHPLTDVREPFDLGKVEYFARHTAKLKLSERLAVAIFFMGCRTHIIDRFKPVFSVKKSKKKADKSGWLGFFYDLAGPKTGTFHEVSACNIYELLSILEKLITDSEKQTRKHNSKK